ncbi:hypothetical protein ACFWX5_03195 [[Kitasatospora] papulosa]|uniref:hypothetical protein n=1 Tax=[Kitasatospora] papulosa TaxID=1464011 RepID=UPI0036A0D9C0
MGTYVDQAKGDGELLADVPVDTFRSHIRFIEKHNLWDEVRGLSPKPVSIRWPWISDRFV